MTQDLPRGADFRLPQFRREVFLRFYEFHLKYKSHPGGVYYLMPYLSQRYGWDLSQRLWYAFVNGCTQHPVTSLVVVRRFPWGQTDGLREWFNSHWSALPFDIDRRYQKKEFPDAVEKYEADAFTAGSQAALLDGDFDRVWKLVRSSFHSFGRLASFSYLEYLRVMGLPIECNTLFLHDLSGSKSHRNGIAKVLGRDDLDWHSSSGFDGNYAPGVIDWLKDEADRLLTEARERIPHPDVGYFTLESTLCCYKSWYRKNRRYPNVYNDMMHDRITHVQKCWPDEDLSVFWGARRETLPAYLRVEDNPDDPGLSPQKQNHFRNTGQVILMGHEWPCFTDDGTWRNS